MSATLPSHGALDGAGSDVVAAASGHRLAAGGDGAGRLILVAPRADAGEHVLASLRGKDFSACRCDVR